MSKLEIDIEPGSFPTIEATSLSTAISLKRIADALELQPRHPIAVVDPFAKGVAVSPMEVRLDAALKAISAKLSGAMVPDGPLRMMMIGELNTERSAMVLRWIKDGREPW